MKKGYTMNFQIPYVRTNPMNIAAACMVILARTFRWAPKEPSHASVSTLVVEAMIFPPFFTVYHRRVVFSTKTGPKNNSFSQGKPKYCHVIFGIPKMDSANRPMKLSEAVLSRVDDNSFQICDSLLYVLHEIRRTQKKVNKLTTLSDKNGDDKNTQP